jgi:hypothetical protein
MDGIVNGAGGRGKVKNIIDLAAIERFADVQLPKLEAAFVAEMVDIVGAAGKQVINGDDRVAFRQ